MAKFDFIATKLISIERSPTGFICRSLEIMGSENFRLSFEARDVTEAQARFNELCANVAQGGKSWHVWADVAKGNRAPRGFRQAKDLHFCKDINPGAVTIKAAA
jgi:hypothetical protein